MDTDGHRVYADAVEDAFGADLEYAMLVKIYGPSNNSPEFSTARNLHRMPHWSDGGESDPRHIATSFIERQNLSIRTGMRRFTRFTNGKEGQRRNVLNE